MKLISILSLMFLSACGYSSRGNEAIGQVKKVVHFTPIACADRTETDISLGVMRNGVGSMSTEDLWFYVTDPSQILVLNEAAKTGTLVKISYNVKRFVLCPDKSNHWINSVELVK